jgi:hypothetical protein
MLARCTVCAAVPPPVVLAASVPRVCAGVAERGEDLAGEAVVAHGRDRPLDAAFVARVAHARGIEMKATRLRVLKKRRRDLRHELGQPA